MTTVVDFGCVGTTHDHVDLARHPHVEQGLMDDLAGMTGYCSSSSACRAQASSFRFAASSCG